MMEPSFSSPRGSLDFEGIWLPLVTPFRDGRVDVQALRALVKHLGTQGAAGFMPCGSTGEAAMLDADEQALVLATTLDAAGDKPVVMGVSGVRPDGVAQRLAQLAQLHPGVAGFLIAPPAYVRPSQRALVDWYHTIAASSPRPIVVYDVPARSGVRIETPTLQAIAEHPRFVAVKDCSGDRAAAHAVLDNGRLALLAGNDDELFDQLARGAAGGVCASAHVATRSFVDLHLAMRTGGSSAEAHAIWRCLRPWVHACFAEPNPAPVKAMLALQGHVADELRAPMHPVDRALRDRLASMAVTLG